MSLPIRQVKVVGSYITALQFRDQIETILEWGSRRQSRVVCVANVHMLMEAYWNPVFARILENADMVTPDGMPLVWMIRQVGIPQDRVAGMDMLLSLCNLAPLYNVSVFFLGSKPEVLEKMQTKVLNEFPHLKVAGFKSLPFRPLTQAEDDALIKEINNSGAGLIFVSLGCPKQEKFIHQHRGKIRAVMIGIGAVFPVYAGFHNRAPEWVRESGLEWFYRLVQEPNRLFGRYAKTIPPFMLLATKQLLTEYHWLDRVKKQYSEIPSNVLIEAPRGLIYRPVGRVLQRAGLLSPDQVQMVLQTQRAGKNLRFGDILTSQGLLKPETIEFFTEQLPELAIHREQHPLGYYLKSAALLNEHQIQIILEKQHKTGLRFGEMAISKGWVKPETVDLFLEFMEPEM